MEILRSESKIKKRKINLKNLEPYNKEKIKLAQQRLNQVIENSFVSHFDNVTYFFQKQKNKDIKFSKFNKNTGCISECKKLKKELKDIGIKTYFVSCNANGFSNKSGDNLVKEAHVFLINPSQRNGKIYFTIFDPGFRMTNPISFFNKTNSPNIPYTKEGTAKVIFLQNNKNYTYLLKVNKRINYKHEITDANIEWKFNPYYQTLNIDDYNEHLYQAIFSLKLMNYPKNISKYICIRSKVLEKTIEIYTIHKKKIFSFEELTPLTLKQIEKLFFPYFKNSNLEYSKFKRFTNNIFLLIHNIDEYISKEIDLKVIEEYKLGNKLNR